MSLHDDLLDQADLLARLDLRRPKQANLRRAVSSAYYALFHLLTREASRLYAEEFGLASRINRTLNHGGMKAVADRVMKGDFPQALRASSASKSPHPYSNDLQSVASILITLQQLRHQADYDLLQVFRRREVLDLVAQVKAAFEAWARIRGTDDARVFLASFHLWDAWNKPPR